MRFHGLLLLILFLASKTAALPANATVWAWMRRIQGDTGLDPMIPGFVANLVDQAARSYPFSVVVPNTAGDFFEDPSPSWPEEWPPNVRPLAVHIFTTCMYAGAATIELDVCQELDCHAAMEYARVHQPPPLPPTPSPAPTSPPVKECERVSTLLEKCRPGDVSQLACETHNRPRSCRPLNKEVDECMCVPRFTH